MRNGLLCLSTLRVDDHSALLSTLFWQKTVSVGKALSGPEARTERDLPRFC